MRRLLPLIVGVIVFIFAAIALCSAAVVADDQANWVGKKVIVANGDAKRSENGKQLSTPIEQGNTFIVTKVSGDLLNRT